MPTWNGQELQLSHTLRQRTDFGPVTVPIHHTTIKQVFSSNRAVVISHNSPVCISRQRQGEFTIGDVVAVRVPLLHLTNFHLGDWPDTNKRPFALMVLMLPADSARRWHVYELELVEVVADQVRNLVKPIISLKKLQVSLTLAPELPAFVVGDDKRLMQIALNVVGNAIKFTKEGIISIKVCLERLEYPMDPLMLEFRPVQDTGVGVNPHDIPKLFCKFLQSNSTTTRNNHGTGLGLAICKRFVNLMGGHIWVESAGLGKGTLVTFVVKLGLPEHPNELDRQMAMRTDFTGVRVLVTDDNGVNRMVTRGLLMRLGCEVTVVSSGRECLQVISQPGQSFKVLLLDVCMPDMDGYEVTIRIQEKFARHERPLLVALTANTDMATRERCLSLGMDRVILKPISLEKMRMVLTELLEFGSRNENQRRP
ncbi:unnamed protein product [Sphagnum balticum]